MQKKTYLTLGLILLSSSLLLTGCGKKEVAPEAEAPIVGVKVQKASESKSAKNELEFPATVVAESEAKIIAKASGNATNIHFNVGDKVSVGTELLKIDDIEAGNSPTAGFNAAQIKQAVLMVNQAQASYDLAKKNYDNLVMSSAKDIKQAEISKSQANTAQSNLNITTAEAIKSAELTLETAKTAKENAKSTLDNKKKILNQAKTDAIKNAETGADAIVSACGGLITNVNGSAAIDSNNSVNVPYRNNLGVLDSSSYDRVKTSYLKTKQLYDDYQDKNFANTNAKVDAAIEVTENCKKLAEDFKYLLEKSISSSNLPQSTLSSMQSGAATAASQLATSVSQANGIKQGLTNLDLSNDATFDSLDKALELANKQEAQAAQALNNLKAGNTSQTDQAGLASIAAENQYENLKVKINTQLASAKTQLDLADIQYKNAAVSLQSLYDNRQVISPINGFVTKKLIADGDTVSAGQLLATVSQTENVKVQFYVDQDTLNYSTPGVTVAIKTSDGKEINGVINAVSPQADAMTKRFLVEVKPDNAKPEDLPLGTVVNIKLVINKSVMAGNKNIILPLAAISIGQNENSIMINDNNHAKKVKVEVVNIAGEFAEVKADINDDAQIIVDGNRLISDGQEIKVTD